MDVHPEVRRVRCPRTYGLPETAHNLRREASGAASCVHVVYAELVVTEKSVTSKRRVSERNVLVVAGAQTSQASPAYVPVIDSKESMGGMPPRST